jgi:hypothetical protein
VKILTILRFNAVMLTQPYYRTNDAGFDSLKGGLQSVVRRETELETLLSSLTRAGTNYGEMIQTIKGFEEIGPAKAKP